MEKIVSRLAPTPSGFLHAGNGVNFVLTWALTRRTGGKLWLRIDDLDAPRMRPEYLGDIFRTIDWLGIDYDAGPTGPDDHLRHFSQQYKQEEYRSAIHLLARNGAHVFACTCSRAEIRSTGGQYPGTCRYLAIPPEQPETALRILTPDTTTITWNDQLKGKVSLNPAAGMRDFVLRRKDGIPAYQIASLVEDIHHQVNLIVRGEDLLYSTAAQIFLSGFISDTTFGQSLFYHHPLLCDTEGNKLSKSQGAFALKSMREQGKGPEEVWREVAKILGIENQEVTSPADLLLPAR